MIRVSIPVFSILCLFCLGFAEGATLYVPDQYGAIQDAIDAAADGDTVVVRPGTYVENIDFIGKAITVRSESGASVTTIDGNQTGSVVTFADSEGVDSVLDGFTVTNGSGTSIWPDPRGGGIYCMDSSPTIKNNIIEGNEIWWDYNPSGTPEGGGIYCHGSATIHNNTIRNNAVYGTWDALGGGIYCDQSTSVTNNIITDNVSQLSYWGSCMGGGIFCRDHATITNNTISDNWAWEGGGIHAFDDQFVTIANNLITNNTGSSQGGGIAATSATICGNTISRNSSGPLGGGGILCTSTTTITSSILWDNDAFGDPNEIEGDPAITYSDVKGGWPGTGNINADPLFFDPANGDFQLRQLPCQPGVINPCVDTADPMSPMVDGSTRTDGLQDYCAVDMGYHYPATGFPIYVPDDHSTIQGAINAAVDWDTIVVKSGTFFENIDFLGKTLFVTSEKGPDATFIDGNQTGCVATFQNGETGDSRLAGFTLTNGSAGHGGGVYCSSSSPSIHNTHIAGNAATTSGGGIYCCNGSPSLTSSEITGNAAALNGGGICCSNGSVTLTDVNITGNSASENGGGVYSDTATLTMADSAILTNAAMQCGGGIYCSASSPLLTDVTVSGNSADVDGGGIYCVTSPATIANTIIAGNTALGHAGGIFSSYSNSLITCTTITENTAGSSGGGLYCDNASPAVTNTILWDNSAPTGSELFGGSPVVTFCDVMGGWPGTGNIDGDPLFVDPAGGDYHITADSPCFNGGDNNAPALPDFDFEGDPRVYYGTADMGVDEYALGGGVTVRVPVDYQSIQDAIDEVLDGDTVLVFPGTYIEHINFLGKAITVKSDSGPRVTVIDGNHEWASGVVKFNSGEGSDSVLSGFTVRNGYSNFGGGVFCDGSSPTIRGNIVSVNEAYDEGGGIYCSDSHPAITSNTIQGNSAGQEGGGIYCRNDSSPTITSNTITGNTALYEGGGIFCRSSSPTVSNNTISNNTAYHSSGGGIYCRSGSNPTITNNMISGNSAAGDGGGICCFSQGSLTITNNTIRGNTAVAAGGGIHCYYDINLTITNTVLWDNSAPAGKEIWIGEIWNPSVVTISYSDVEGGQSSVYVDPYCTLNWGDGMIDADPNWMDPSSDDFHLTWDSPCKNSGDNTTPGLPSVDFEGDPRIHDSTVDMGADEFHLHLYEVGDVIPGSSIDLKVVGPPSSPARLLLGSGIQDPPQSTWYGDLYLELPLLGNWGLGSIPGNGILIHPATVPPGVSSGDIFPFQAYVFIDKGTLSNLMALTVE